MARPPRRLIWSPEAESDLLEIWHWGASRFSADIADKHLRDIASAANNLCDFPETGRARDDLLPGLRAVVVFPIVVFYRLRSGGIEIVRVVDGRLNIAAMFGSENS